MENSLYVFEGTKADKTGRYAGKLPIDITIGRDLAEDMRPSGKARTDGELRLLFCDLYWAQSDFYYLRNVGAVDISIAVDLVAILQKEEDRRGIGIDVCRVNLDRKPRTYTVYRPIPRWLEDTLSVTSFN
ncbi:hypothetical protein KY331_02765 [Candidatus Woesearchaeota archaeon]|nr:hypothetical protein [Candidatus Woesearchaeota archaeon]